MKHRGKLVATVIVGAVVVAALFGLKQIFGGSANGTIKPGTARTPQTTSAAPALVAQQTKYSTFNYSSSFTPVASDPAVYPVLANYNYIKSQLGSWQLAIQITDLPTGNISDNGSYNYRKVTTAQYSFTSQMINNQSVPIVTDKTNGAFNEVAYLVHGTKIATVSLMGGNGQDTDQLKSALAAILSSWQWQ